MFLLVDSIVAPLVICYTARWNPAKKKARRLLANQDFQCPVGSTDSCNNLTWQVEKNKTPSPSKHSSRSGFLVRICHGWLPLMSKVATGSTGKGKPEWHQGEEAS